MPQDRYQRPKRQRDEARIAAFEALQAVTLDGAYGNLALAEMLQRGKLEERDAAFATELCHGTCRGLGTYDAVIEAAGGRTLDSMEAAVVDVLRLGTHQLLAMRVPTHAAVAASVDLAAVTTGERATGIVNAILRKVAQRDLDAWVDLLAEDDEADRLALSTQHPDWIVQALADVLPAEELEDALRANNVAPHPTLVVRPGQSEVADLGKPTRWSPFGATSGRPPHTVPLVRVGKAGVQDEGSQLVAWALSLVDGAPEAPWLDLCAGPGGKAALLAGLAREQGSWLLSSEVAPHRAELVRKALRTYPGFPRVICADGTRPAWRPGAFSHVMADVPCSGLGSLRRRPESRWRRLPEDIVELQPLQRALLAQALEAAAPGGVVAYVTCSPHRDETAGVVHAVLAERDDVDVLDAPSLLPGVANATASTDPRFVQLWPHRHGTDAMFLALLRRR